MSWRHHKEKQITGQNAVPLGTARRWGAPAASSAANEMTASSSSAIAEAGQKRGREDESNSVVAASIAGDAGAPRKRRSRWGEEKTNLGVPTALGANVSEADLERHASSVRIEEIGRKLRSGDVVPPERERSPSPAPQYDAQGRRTNTREVRYRKKLEDERMELIDKQIKMDPNFKPPLEYIAARKNLKLTEKVFLPVAEFPEINFFGLLVGPRGNSLKKMENESGAKISIRGKGSVKAGKGKVIEDENEEEMHCVIVADDEEKVRKCIRLINTVIETAASTPEAQNDHKRNQLRELAALNGTLRDDENQLCQNCGQKGHRKYECPEQRNWTSHVVCHKCGQQGHLARDCMQGRNGMATSLAMPMGNGSNGGAGGGGVVDAFNSEYENLMAELGQGSGSGGGGGVAASAATMTTTTTAGQSRFAGKKIPPWRDPNVWNAPTPFGGNSHLRGPRFGNAAAGGGGGFQGHGYPPQQQGYAPQQPGMAGAYQPFQQHQQQQRPPAFQQHLSPQQMHQQQQHSFPPYHHQQQQQQARPMRKWGGSETGSRQSDSAGEPQAEAATATAAAQPDYRQAWEEYYRQQGMTAEAAAAAAGGNGNATGGDQGTAAATDPSIQQQEDYARQWEEYYRQQAAAAGAQIGGTR